MNGFLKALLASAFFVSAASALGASSDCSPPGPLQTASLRQVIDGDTLELSDGRRVRLIGINTPELAHDTRPAQPLAEDARRAADTFLRRDPSATLQLAIGTDSHDRYGRLLAHVFDRDGNSLEAQLLEQGLGFPLSIPPNLALRECLQQQAHHARSQGLGVWSHPAFAPRQVTTLTPADGGYGRYRGQVSRVDRNRSGWFLELDQQLYLPIEPASAGLFEPAALQALTGQSIEVSGWLSYRQLNASQRARQFRPFRLRLQHPDQLTSLRTN